MEQGLKDIIYFMISYVVVIAGGFFFANFFSNGFLWAFIKTKISRGKKILIIVHSQPRNYHTYGWVEGQKLKYFDSETKRNDKNKTPKSVIIQKGMFTQTFNVWMAEIDEATGNIIMPDKDHKPGFDPILQENLIIQALQKNVDPKTGILLIIVIVIGLLVLVALILGFLTLQKVGVMQGSLSTLAQIANGSISGMNI